MSARNVLVVDDDPDIRSLLKHHLEAEGHAVMQAVDGQSGLALAESERPDLILLDLALPTSDGLTVLQRLKESDQVRNVPVIIITSLRSESCRNAAVEAQASGFLQKPFDRTALLEAIGNCAAPDAPAGDPCHHCGRSGEGIDHRTVEAIAEKAAIAAVREYVRRSQHRDPAPGINP